MGDRSYVSLWIYEIPQGKTEDVLKVLEDYGFSCYGTSSVLDTNRLLEVVGERDDLFIEDTRIGTANEVSDELEELGVTHQSHQDPVYEFMGDLHRFHPELGRWDGDANADADAVITALHLRYHVRRQDPMPGGHWNTEVIQWIDRRLGITYEDKFRELTGQKALV